MNPQRVVAVLVPPVIGAPLAQEVFYGRGHSIDAQARDNTPGRCDDS
jgi:hypothetical protein